MKEYLSKELLNFIVHNVDSVEFLEVLSLFVTHPEMSWTVTEIDDVIRSNSQSIETRLKKLLQLEFIRQSEESPVRYHLKSTNESLTDLAQSLVSAYRNRRVEIAELIYTKRIKEIVSFSDAFNLRGGKKKDG